MAIVLHVITMIVSYLAIIFLYTTIISLLLFPFTHFWELKVGRVYIAKYTIVLISYIMTLLTITVKTPYL